MGDTVHMLSGDGETQMQKGRLSKSYIVRSPILASKRVFHHLICPSPDDGLFSQTLLFLLKVGALEIVRRFSKSRAPFIWHGIQSLQFLICPPFNWIKKWSPLKKLIEGIQVLSRPLMFLSAVTAFSDHCQRSKRISHSKDSPTPSSTLEVSEERIVDDISKRPFDRLDIQLRKELQEGTIFPDRINSMEIQNFYTAADGDYASLKKSVLKTIRWRESFSFLSSQELEMWSHLVFWHGRALNFQPCLIIRVGLAFSSLTPDERPSFVQAVVSQIEHGVLHLVNSDSPKVTALVDCDGLVPARFPMQMLKSCTTLLQDHYPNRLTTLLVTRLSPSALAIAETFLQNLKSTTRKKVHILGEIDAEILAEFLHNIPSFLGGSCRCGKCHEPVPSSLTVVDESSADKLNRVFSDSEKFCSDPGSTSGFLTGNCEQVLRTVVICILMLWVFLVFLIGMQDPDGFLTA